MRGPTPLPSTGNHHPHFTILSKTLSPPPPYSHVHSEKSAKSRGRILPMAQLTAARKVVGRKLKGKRLARGYAEDEDGSSPEDSEVEDTWQSGRSTAAQRPCTSLVPVLRPDQVDLPQSDLRRAPEYQREQPADGEGLVGWVVCGFFAANLQTPWFDGVVVAFSEHTREHLVFYEADSSWEVWVLPDPGLIYATVPARPRGSRKAVQRHPPHRVTVQKSWLPRRGKGLKGSIWA